MRVASVLKFRLLQVGILHYPGSEQQRCWSDFMDVQAELRLCCSHMAQTGFFYDVAPLQSIKPTLASGAESYQNSFVGL